MTTTSTAATSATPALDAPLPYDAATRGAGAPASYRAYPVFGRPWLARRTLWFGLGTFLFAIVTGVGTGVSLRSSALGAQIAALTWASFFLMSTVGPTLATIVRHRRFSPRRERWLVPLAIVLGVIASFVIDAWASPRIETLMKPAIEAGDVDRVRRDAIDPKNVPWLYAFGIVFEAGLYLALGGGIALRAYFSEQARVRDSERRRELDELRASAKHHELKLAALQAQVEPHFLFNTLAALRSLVEREPARATAMIDALVDYLRATIPDLRDDGESRTSTLARQVEICAHYLAVMQVRMGDRLDVAIDVPDALRDAAFPPLLLLTLVENAVKHGVEPKPGRGSITIRANADGGRLVVSVIDDGVGLRGTTGTGLGLANVRAQLAARYGETATFDLSGRIDGGATATLRLPLERGRA